MTENPQSPASAAPPPSPNSAFPLFVFAAIVLLGAAMILSGLGMILTASGGVEGALAAMKRRSRSGSSASPFATSSSSGAIAPKMHELMAELVDRLAEVYDKAEIQAHESIVQRAPETRALVDHPDVLQLTISFDAREQGLGVLWKRKSVIPLARISRKNSWRKNNGILSKTETYLGADKTRQPLQMYMLQREIKATGVRLKILVHVAGD